MIRIRKKPFIYENTDRWGQALGTYSVSDACGYCEEGFAKELFEFENYSPHDDQIEWQIKNGVSLEHVYAPKMSRLLARSKYKIWEFNLLCDLDTQENTQEYIRSYAVFGEKTLKEHVFIDTIHVLVLRVICWFKNRRAKNVKI